MKLHAIMNKSLTIKIMLQFRVMLIVVENKCGREKKQPDCNVQRSQGYVCKNLRHSLLGIPLPLATSRQVSWV